MGLGIVALTLSCPLLIVLEVKFRLLCYDREGPKLSAFTNWKEGTRALVTGNIVFSDDASAPLDLIVTTIEPNIPADMYCNQVVLGNAFFGSDEIRERKNDQVAVKIGTTLDNSDVTTWLYLETHESRKKKLHDRIRKGRAICVQGYLREYRKKMVALPIAPLSQAISLLEKTSGRLHGVQRRTEARLAMRKQTPRPITNGWRKRPPYWWEHPIYEHLRQ